MAMVTVKCVKHQTRTHRHPRRFNARIILAVVAVVALSLLLFLMLLLLLLLLLSSLFLLLLSNTVSFPHSTQVPCVVKKKHWQTFKVT